MLRPPKPLPIRQLACRLAAFRWLTALVCGWLCFAGLASGLAQGLAAKEYEIKAAYLYNFAKFVEWPEQCFTNRQSPLVIGVFGHNPFGDELKAIAKDHKINGRDIVIKTVGNLADAEGVNLMYIGAEEDGRVVETLVALKCAPVLTVGESEKFISSGGIIRFVREADEVHFEINATAAEQQGLKISAQLLKLAKSIRKEP